MNEHERLFEECVELLRDIAAIRERLDGQVERVAEVLVLLAVTQSVAQQALGSLMEQEVSDATRRFVARN